MDEGDGLENRYAGNCIVGSNPTPSAILLCHTVPLSLIYMRFVSSFSKFAS